MDPENLPDGNATTLASDILSILKANFIRHYNDVNKPPFGLYLHAAAAVVEPARLQ